MRAGMLVAVLLVACDGEGTRAAREPLERPDGEVELAAGWEGRCGAAPTGPFAGTLDDLYLAVASIEPAFAGVYVSDTGRLVMVLTDLARLEPAACAFVAVLGGDAVARYGPPSAVRGTYGWTELYEWKRAASVAFATGWVTLLDLDELWNRVVIGVWPESRIAEVADALVAAGIPREGMIVEARAPAVPL